jgi:RNA polymerase subunit RPABC4/transcription elongation factor Spt4
MDKSFVTIEKKLCPVCAHEHESGSLLLDKKVRPKFDMYTTTGYDLCPECKKKFDDGYLALVVCDIEKSKINKEDKTLKMENAHRTGAVVHMKRSAVERMFPGIPADLPLMFIDEELGNKLKGYADALNKKPKTKVAKKTYRR